jgi:DNA-binding XRE family transcriptional regulator
MLNRVRIVRMDDEQDTMPIPIVHIERAERPRLPTVQQVRELCRMSYFEAAQMAGVNPRIVYWMEKGISVYPLEAVKILRAFSYVSGQSYTLNNVRGIRLK